MRALLSPCMALRVQLVSTLWPDWVRGALVVADGAGTGLAGRT